jgi:hypothetical protein
MGEGNVLLWTRVRGAVNRARGGVQVFLRLDDTHIEEDALFKCILSGIVVVIMALWIVQGLLKGEGIHIPVIVALLFGSAAVINGMLCFAERRE